MPSQKMENQLRMALELPESVRQETLDLDTGFSEEEDTWTVIVRYVGDIDRLETSGITITKLLGGFAVATLPASRIDTFAVEPEIIYMEKPKRLNFAVAQGKRSACFAQVSDPPENLTGEGVLIGIVDSGLDFFHDDFRNSDGTTRLAAYWDQTGEGRPPRGYRRGRLYTEEEINALLAGEEESARAGLDASGHGTAVAGIAAGNGRGQENGQAGAAPGSRILAVKLGTPGSRSFPRTTELMTGVDFLVRTAQEMGMPIAVNISFGNNYGSHSGDSLMASYLNVAADYGRTVICIGTGNEGELARHASSVWEEGVPEVTELSVSEYQTSFNLQLWKDYEDRTALVIVHPDNRRYVLIEGDPGLQERRLGQTDVLIYYGQPAPYSMQQELYIEFIPRDSYVDEGVWKIVAYPYRIIRGEHDYWLPSGDGVQAGTIFLKPDPERTMTEPSPAAMCIAVAAYNSVTQVYAPFSGRGYPRQTALIHPVLAAPGVNIRTSRAGGGQITVTGTSFATPFVTGAAALLMEWGIVRGNDPYLYGQKVKAYLISGARRIPSEREYPNPRVGFGVLCVGDSLPG